ncbi:MAG: HD domain-containing protein [Bacteroidetes bacterium]|nr:HD domain-containing protein [Bacteroidota bacterium]
MDLIVIQGKEGEGTDAVARDIIGVLSREIEHVSVSLRTLDDVAGLLQTDIRSWMALLEAVHICGAREVYDLFQVELRKTLLPRMGEMLEGLETLISERYRQYGSAVALLEPNIKYSAGTLRDIHAIFFLTLTEVLRESESSGRPLASVPEVIVRASVNPDRRKAIIEARSFFLSVRSAMHEISGHLHDTLDFELQRHVAERMGFSGSHKRRGVEVFMREYYRHARAIHVSLQLVLYDLKKKEGLNERSKEKMLFFPAGDAKRTDLSIMGLFHEMATSGRVPAGDVVRALENMRPVRFTAPSLLLFDSILREGQHIGGTLMFMHAHGFLSAVLPEFAGLEHFFQHNIYHFYTADEHTLRAIGALESSLREDAGVLAVLNEIEDKSVLYYAVLLHDIAKPIDLPRHEQVGADLVPTVLRRFGRDKDTGLIAFLVRNHLRMEQLAFRRNFREISTLQPFVEEVLSVQRLNLLYLLTLADMSALNPGILTDWKKELLRELYTVARHLMETGTEKKPAEQHSADERQQTSGMSEDTYSIAVQDVLDGASLRIHFQHHRAYSEATVFCVDRPMLLAHFSAALFGADCSIVDASIETINDVVIDTFRLVDIFSGSHLREEQERQVRDTLRAVCAGETDSERLFDRCRRKWVRKLRRLPQRHVTVDVRYIPHQSDEGREQTIVEVYAPDTFGLLYRLASELSAFGLNVVFAKIATRVDGVVDSFYVVDSAGRAFVDEQRREQLRSRILHQITELTR